MVHILPKIGLEIILKIWYDIYIQIKNKDMI